MKYSILRPVAFIDNFCSTVIGNPLKKGKIKGLTLIDHKLKHVACRDIGKVAAIHLSNPDEWNKKTTDCVGEEFSGADAARICTEVTGNKTVYGMVIPRFVLKFAPIPAVRDFWAMIKYFEREGGYQADISEFKQLVPDAWGLKELLQSKG